MSYIGNNLQVAYPSYLIIDDISSQFNGVLKTFALRVAGSTPVPFPINPQQCLLSVNNIVQKPDSTGASGFTLTGSNIVFATAPTAGWSFFGTVLAGADYVNVGANFPSGTAAVPSVTFDESTGTGLFLASSNVLGIATSGVQQLTVDSSGRVGIGTSSPAFAVDISAANDTVVRSRTNGNTSAGFIGSTNSGTNNWFFGSRKDATGGSSGTDRFNLLYDTNAFLTVTTAGNVGIGTTSPAALLDVYKGSGSSYVDSILLSNTLGNGANQGIAWGSVTNISGRIKGLDDGASGTHLIFENRTGGPSTTTTERARIDSSGRVGIGTTVANSKLSIGLGSSTNDGLTLTFTGDNSTVARFFADTATGQVSIGGIGASYFPVFYAGAAEKARIDTSGRLLVGTSSARSNFFNGVASAALQLEGTGTNRRAAIIGDDFEASLILASQKSGAVGGNTVLASGDPVGAVSFQGNDGSEFVEAATITAFVDGTPGANDMPGRLVFSTTADGAATPTERVRIDSSGRLLVGTSTALLLGSSLANFAINTETLIGGGVLNHNLGATRHGGPTPEAGPVICLARSRGTTIGAVTLVANGDTLGVLEFSGADGTDFGTTAATIRCEVDGTPGANDMPGRLVFSTTADGASSPTERMRITSAGYLKVSDNNSYQAVSVGRHELNQSANEALLMSHVSNTGYTGDVHIFNVNKAANSNYVFLRCYSDTFADTEFNLRGDGNAFADGSWTGGGADYAEYFEWSDSNPNTEDRRGISVVLDGDKIREAVVGEDPIGVISGNPSVVGDAAWNKWSGKYLRDEFGTYIQEGYEVEDENGNTVVQQRRKLNPAYDPDVEYVSREQRPEWDCVGLMGKLRIRKGQITGSRWIKMRDINDFVEEWLVR